MAEIYRTIEKEGCGEIEEKRSRFLSVARHIETQDEMAAFLEERRKAHWDARHNCSACIIGKNMEYRHSSDDGEPSGTAGKPMLDILTGSGLTDVGLIVTRYFGGTLLGTGGLVRAYSEAARAALRDAGITEKTLREKLTVTADYNSVGKLQYLFGSRQIPILDSRYEENVTFVIAVMPEDTNALLKAAADATGGRAVINKYGEIWL